MTLKMYQCLDLSTEKLGFLNFDKIKEKTRTTTSHNFFKKSSWISLKIILINRETKGTNYAEPWQNTAFTRQKSSCEILSWCLHSLVHSTSMLWSLNLYGGSSSISLFASLHSNFEGRLEVNNLSSSLFIERDASCLLGAGQSAVSYNKRF